MSPRETRDHAAHELDALSEALDGRLTGAPLEATLARVRSCPECRAAYEAMAWTRKQVARLTAVDFPAELEAHIRGGLDRESARPAQVVRARRAVGVALAAVLVLSLAAVVARQWSRAPGLVAAVAADYRERASGQLVLALETSDPARLESRLAAAPLGFPPRVYDLRMMGYELRGGVARIVSGRARAVIVYREVATGRELFCEMVVGRLSDLPAPDSVREHDEIQFQVHAVGDVTLVIWPEGDVLCVLAGAGDPEALVQLAFAKAMKARPRES